MGGVEQESPVGDLNMTEAQPNPFRHHLRHLIGSVSAAALTDGQLLERFLVHRDETAVEVLVRRYGPLVHGVCRRVLHSTHSAEDAFQATFLVLIRKARSLDRRKALGNWLYTVAYRLALRARANEVRRLRSEIHAARTRPPVGGPVASSSDLLIALEEELHRLPARHRAPLVLCYFEGKTNEEAAAILRCPRGSIAARLAQARERLRQRLALRGFTAPAAGIACALATAAAPAAVPLPLIDSTVRGALWLGREEPGAGMVSPRAVALARGTVRALFLSRLKIAGALLLALALMGTGAAMLLKAASQADSPLPIADAGQGAQAPGAAADPNANAAMQYGQAFIALRRGVGEPDKLYAECLTMPLDAHAREVVARGAYALRVMHRGAASARCDWSVPTERGVDVPFTHGDGALVLGCLACLRARLRFEEGHNNEALSDLVAALTLARHVSQDGTLDGLWGGYKIEARAGEILAGNLQRLDLKSIKDLQTRLDALPPGGSVAGATMRMEESLLGWIVGEVEEAKDRESLLDFLSQLAGFKSDAPEKNQAKGRALLEACGGNAEGVLRFAEEMRQHYPRMTKTLDLHADHVDQEFEHEAKKLADNPVYKVFAPVLHNVRRRQAQTDVRRALLATALAVRLEGRDGMKRHSDPVVGGQFDYVAFEGGFELRSQWKRDDQPVTLTVGRRGK
jgi:RNA polymerase sigma factor (sigma-70 family)